MHETGQRINRATYSPTQKKNGPDARHIASGLENSSRPKAEIRL